MVPEGQVFIIPVRFDSCEIPSKFSHLQFLNYFTMDGPNKLIKAVTLYFVLEREPTVEDKDIIIDADKKKYLVEIAKRPGTENKVVDYLIEALYKRKDPAERYWIYLTLGEIGGKRAKLTVEKGLSDVNEFARMGADAAWKVIKPRWSRNWWLLSVLSLLLSLVVAILLFQLGNHSELPHGSSQIPSALIQTPSHQYILRIKWIISGEISVTIIDSTGACSEVLIKYTNPPPSRYLEFRF